MPVKRRYDDLHKKETYKFNESSRGKNSFKRATLSSFLPDKSTELRESQYGSNGWISVITSTSRSCATPNEHSVRNVAFGNCEDVFVRCFGLDVAGRTVWVRANDHLVTAFLSSNSS